MSTKIFKKLISVVMTVILLISTFIIPSFAASKAKLNYTAKQITYGKTVTLKVSGYSGKVTWSTSDKTVAAVSTKGVVKAVNLGSAKITAKAGKQTLTCKIKVVDVNTNASVSLKVSDGGYFIKGVSKATAAFTPKANCAKAVATIYDSDGDKVYSKTFTSLKKNKAYSFSWSGKNSSGKYVPAGKYQLCVKIGTTTSKSSYLKFETSSLFAGGNGSKTNPFLIETTAQFNSIGKYPNSNFKQVDNLDFEYESAKCGFSKDKPFNGVYDGDNKTISNLSSKSGLFEYVGEKGQIKNVIMKNCSVIATCTEEESNYGVLANVNEGKITNCKVNGTVTITTKTDNVKAGALVGYNNGTISNCSTSGSSVITGNTSSIYSGGIVGYNDENGKILSCSSSVYAKVDCCYFCYAGGICGANYGMVNNSEATGTVDVSNCSDNSFSGGIAGVNKAQIKGCTYNGSKSSLVGDDYGVVS